jgi:hypothetical protein
MLLVPVLLSAVAVFFASSLIHMVLGYHAADWRPAPDEEAVRAALRLPPGDYIVPHARSMADMKGPEYSRKLQEGPVAYLTVAAPGNRMGAALAQWFVYCLVASVFAGYVASRAVGGAGDYLDVFRFAGATAFAAYGLGIWQQAIWYSRGVGATLRSTFDALVYAGITAGMFGWWWS